MLGPNPQDRFWYLTLYNETYPMPTLPEGEDAVRRGIIEGTYKFADAPEVKGDLRASLCFSGPMWSVATGGAGRSWPSAMTSPPTPGR